MPSPGPAGLKIRLLGPPGVERDGQARPFAQKKGWLLLGYLAVERRADRTRLAERLWPEHDTAAARGRLRRVVYEINRAFGAAVVTAVGDQLRLTDEARAATDLCRLRAGLAQRRSGVGVGPPDSGWLVDLGGELLEGIDGEELGQLGLEWLTSQREACRQLALQALELAAEAALRAGRSEEAEALQVRRVQLDPIDEEAVRVLVATQLSRGRAGSARAALQALERHLGELGLPPGPATRALRAAIERGRTDLLPEPPPPDVRYLVNDGVHIAYATVGQGPLDVLVVPGFVTHLEQGFSAGGPSPFFRRLAARARLIFFDRRGIGLSDRLGHRPDLDETLSDMLAVLDAVDSRRAVLAGFSEGGPLCIELASCQPERCAGLFLYGTMARGSWAPDYPFALTDQQFDDWCDHLIRRWGRPAGLEVFAPGHGDDHRLASWWSRLLRSGATPGSVRVVLDAFRRMDVRDRLATVAAPAVVVHRQGDRAVPLEGARRLAAALPNAAWVELEGDDHWWWLGDAEAVLSAAFALLDRVAAGPGPAARAPG